MATKYQEYFNLMIKNNKEAFLAFNKLYSKYTKDQDSLQDVYNVEGKKIMEIIHEWENKLCARTEKAGFGNYSTNLSEKFRIEQFFRKKKTKKLKRLELNLIKQLTMI